MMKFKHFLVESDSTNSTIKAMIENVDSAMLDLFLSVADDSMATEAPLIYRGTNKSQKIIIQDYPLNRNSRNTTNEFTILVDNFLPSWKNYPKRSKSFICTTSHYIADGYGEPYFVLPYGNPDIGVCSDIDMWDSLKNIDKIEGGYAHVPLINNALNVINDNIHENKSKQHNLESVNNMRAFIELVNSIIRDDRYNKCLSRIKQDVKQDVIQTVSITILENAKKLGDIVKSIDSLLNTSTNNFKLIKFKDMNKNSLYDNEIWFSAPAAFIKCKDIMEIKDKIEKIRG